MRNLKLAEPTTEKFMLIADFFLLKLSFNTTGRQRIEYDGIDAIHGFQSASDTSQCQQFPKTN